MDLPPVQPEYQIPTFKQYLSLPEKKSVSFSPVIVGVLIVLIIAVIYVFIANWATIKRISVQRGLSSTGGHFPILSNTGVVSLGSGSGITLTGTANDPIVSNSGVLSVDAGTGCTNGGTAQNRVINCAGLGASGVSSVTVNGGSSITGNVNLKNGTNTAITANGQDITISSTYSASPIQSGVYSVTSNSSIISDLMVPGMTATGVVNLTYIDSTGDKLCITSYVPTAAQGGKVDLMIGCGSTGQPHVGDKILWSVAKLS